MRRPPMSLYLMTIAGLVLSVLLIWEGLHIQLFMDFRDPDALWLLVFEKVGSDPIGLGWPWIVLGISWISALCGVWLGLPWGRWALWVVCVLSLLYVEVGTIMAVLVILVLALPASQRWVKGSHDTGTG